MRQFGGFAVDARTGTSFGACEVVGLRPLDQDSRAKVDAIRIIGSLPKDAEQYRRGSTLPGARKASSTGGAVQGFISFVLQNFQYRYVSVHDYLRSHNQPGARVVDLLLPNLVDYDWWLAKGVSLLNIRYVLWPLRLRARDCYRSRAG